MDQTFRCHQHKNSKKQNHFDILRTVVPKRIEHTNFTCMGSPCALLQNPPWSVKYRSKCSKGYKNCKIFVQNMLVNLYLHIFERFCSLNSLTVWTYHLLLMTSGLKVVQVEIENKDSISSDNDIYKMHIYVWWTKNGKGNITKRNWPNFG